MVKPTRRQFINACILSGTSLSLFATSGCMTSSSHKPLINELNEHLRSPVIYWTDVMLQAVRDLSLSPLHASRGFAMAHLAGYKALTNESFGLLDVVQMPDNVATGKEQAEIAYGIAFSVALEEAWSISFLSARQRFLKSYQNKDDRTYQWADDVAREVAKLRNRDGAQKAKNNVYPKQYAKQNGPLNWGPTGSFYGAKNGPRFNTFARGEYPAWGAQKTWLIDSVTNYEAQAFPALGSEEFVQEFSSIKTLGRSKSEQRSEEQTEIALFWEDGLMGITVVGHFQLFALQLATQRKLSIVEQAHLFATLSIAQADAGIVAWHSKYKHDIIRPETAIRFANKRFNQTPNLSADSHWNSYIPTPSFPAYVSGHSAFGAASCQVMTQFFGGDRIDLQSPAPDMVNWPKQLKGVRRHYHSLQQMSEECGMSRLYGGVHWSIDNTEGLRLGNDVANAVMRHAGVI